MSKSKKVPGPQYPFPTKREILEQIKTDDIFVLECLQIMHSRQLSFEQESRKTVVKNRRGWMSSHAVNGTKLAEKAKFEGLDSEDLSKVRGMVAKYHRQLAEHFREEMVANNPDLAKVAAIFSATC